jgi:F0F1-type ATP synthase membrane subunit b/b'
MADKRNDTAKDKVVKPETEEALKEAADSIKHAGEKSADAAKAQAGAARDQARESAEGLAEEAKAQAQHATSEARSRMENAPETARARAEEEARRRKDQATSALGTTSSDLRRASEAVEEDWMASAFSNVADQIDNFTRSLDSRSPVELQRAATRAAREHPGLFLAGCFAAGVAISRTLRVAADRQPEHYYEDEEEERRMAGAHTPPQRDYGTTSPPAPRPQNETPLSGELRRS